MKKQDALTEIETIRARLTVLESIVQQPERHGLWNPVAGREYWFLSPCGKVYNDFHTDHHVDDRRISGGNVFPTREAAEKAAPLFARAHKIIVAALQADPDAGEWCVDRIHTVTCESAGWHVVMYPGPWAAVPVFVHTNAQAEEMARILNTECVK